MSLLNRVANQEVLDFLKTVTIKYSYFAYKIRESTIRKNLKALVPETANPYVIHLAGEYVLDPTTFPTPDYIKNDGVWFKGYRKTNDTKRNQYKNYWQLVGNNSLRHVPIRVLEQIVNPKAVGLYELQPLIIEGIKDPVTGELHTYEFRASQNLYDRNGNLAFEFPNHRVFTGNYDEMMYVTSLDTGQEIPFALESFYTDCALAAGLPATSVHRKTLEAYRIPNRYYDILCEKYPKQVDLIKAIVYRVPTKEVSSLVTIKEIKDDLKKLMTKGLITRAYYDDLFYRFKTQEDLVRLMGQDLEGIRHNDQMSLSEARRTRVARAGNLELLHCNTDRLNSNERVSMVEHLVKTLEIVKRRWAVDEFNYEANYAAVLWSMLWSVLPVAMIAKRYANIKTPAVSVDHMWDYLNSKGLQSYNGYLTEKQTWFLYKNINYLLQHAGQQRALNILIDNILADYGLTLKAKTVVLDTTKSLTVTDKPAVYITQCSTCSRRGVTCFKNITNYTCDEWLGTKTLCKAEPIVLTEAFAGATKEKIIRALKKSFGYDQIDNDVDREKMNAMIEEKYRRSFIWKDDDIEAIKDDLDRDQIVDITGKIESMEEILDIEHAGGQEPVVNSDIVDEQRVELRNMRGTYAPTKLLEMVRTVYNARFSNLFNKFLTETLYRFSTKVKRNGTYMNHVSWNYTFTTLEGASEYNFTFNELLAASYFGFVREYNADSIVDTNVGYDTSKNRYWEQKWLTDFSSDRTLKFAIPNKARVLTAIRFGKPVRQEELVAAYRKELFNREDEGYVDYTTDLLPSVTNNDERTRVVSIRDTLYAITLAQVDPTAETKTYDVMWDDYQFVLNSQPCEVKVLGEFVPERNGDEIVQVYYENNDEIPVIPKFFRWYYMHLNPEFSKMESGEAEGTKVPIIRRYEDGEYSIAEIYWKNDPERSDAYDGDDVAEVRTIQEGINYYDETTAGEYRIFALDTFLDVDSLLDRWVDAIGIIYDQATIARYIDTMFTILEDVYCFASQSGSIRTHHACTTFLDKILFKGRIDFDLVGIEKTHISKTDPEELIAYYSDWLSDDNKLGAAFKIIENMSNQSSGWNEFNIAAISCFTSGCTIPYCREILDGNQYKKLKQLVLQLSSYRITIVDEAESDRECIPTAPIVVDNLIDQIELDDRTYFDPVGDAVYAPRLCTCTPDVNTGDFMVRTMDLRRVDGKQYYRLRTYSRTATEEGIITLLPDVESLSSEATLIHPSGTRLPIANNQEMINIPEFYKWYGFDKTFDTIAAEDKEYFRYNEESETFILQEVEVGVTRVEGLYEQIKVGARLPEGECYEKMNIYDVLGIEEGTPILIYRDDRYNWYYRTGTKVDTEVKYPSARLKTDYCKGHVLEVEESEDRFDLKNNFSNEVTALTFGSPVYRISVPAETVEWSDLNRCQKLDDLLTMSMCSDLIVSDFLEPSICMITESDADGRFEINNE